jgi:hypothetical protein
LTAPEEPVEEPVAEEEAPAGSRDGEEGFPAGTQLQILQWSHFVPRYDEWFDGFAAEWGSANGVNVTVDHLRTSPRSTRRWSRRWTPGRDRIWSSSRSAASKYVDGVHDLR